MALGILEDKYLERVPGTTIFSDDPNAAARSAYEGVDLGKLKHATGKNAHIVLVPQPSDDPNDPLNWPQWKKHMVFFVMTYGTVICGAIGPLVSADSVGIAAEYNRSVSAVSRALGSALVLALAFATDVWSVLSIKFGKRPVFLVSTLMMFAGSMIASYADEYNTLLGARILQGVGMAVLEYLVGAVIGDIYFTHERGVPVAIWNVALLNGINITPPIAGQIIEHLGWRYCFKIFAISCGLLFLLQSFCMPETTYHHTQPTPMLPSHEPHFSTLTPSDRKSDTIKVDVEEVTHSEKYAPSTPSRLGRHNPIFNTHAPRSYISSLRVYNGVYPTRSSVCTLLVRPFLACLTPVCLWAGLLYGIAVTWLVLIATSVAQIFSAEPYNFTASQIGLTYMSPFVFSFLAAILCGPLTDYVARRMSAANQGIFEPEFRLVLVVFYGIFGSLGFFGWGISANNRDPWIGPVIFFGLINFGVTIGGSAALGYVVDAHRHIADSAMGAVIVFKNMAAFVITLFINDWIAVRGILNAFCVAAGVTLFTSLLTIPMYIYGKRARSWIHRNLHFEDEETTNIAH